MAILLSLALMLTMAIPVTFADDTAQASQAEAVQAESAEETEEPAVDPVQVADEAAEEAPAQEEASEEAQGGITVEEISLDEEDLVQSRAKLANVNRAILVAGIDNGGRADIVLILCFTAENKAKLFAVARDTYMQLNPSRKYNVDGKARDFCKCNRAAEYGGLDVLMTELNRHLDLNITEYVGADWDCVATLIDNSAVGGLSVNLTDKNMVNAINELIVGTGKAKKVTTGKQTLTGWQAVEYLRVRKHIEKPEGKGARVREDRNRDVFIQLYNQLKNSDKKDLIYNAIAGKIVTNMSPAGIKALYDQFGRISVEPASQYPYTSKMYWDKWADMYYLVPTKSLETNTITLHRNVLGQGSYKPSATVKSLSKTIAKHIKKKTILAKKPKLPSVAKATVTLGKASYTGKAVTPSVTVKLKKKKLKATYYTVTYKNNVNIGKASIVIEGRCGYGGTKTVTFDISPAGTSLTGLTAGSKSFTAAWTEQAAKMPSKTIDGYQIQYGLKKNFKKAKTMTVAGYTNTTATIGKLKAKKKYYVRVRTYVGSGKSAVYSDWSSAKTVKPTK